MVSLCALFTRESNNFGDSEHLQPPIRCLEATLKFKLPAYTGRYTSNTIQNFRSCGQVASVTPASQVHVKFKLEVIEKKIKKYQCGVESRRKITHIYIKFGQVYVCVSM